VPLLPYVIAANPAVPATAVDAGYNNGEGSGGFLTNVVGGVRVPTSGPIDDVQCNIEDLEQANDSQLYSILHDITKTAFFRRFEVDLTHKCPLRQWRQHDLADTDDDEEKQGRDDSSNEDEGDEEEANVFECDGGKDELDDDAEPLCKIQPGDDEDDPFGMPLESNALSGLSQSGFQSKQQQDTFAWRNHKDLVVEEEDVASSCDEEDEGFLPASFWLDMCSNIRADNSDAVNLVLNPERNTGYNGTHIWKAIYEENCIAVDGDTEGDMCFEERVLYRLLSGLHASTTLSIAVNYYPPSKRKGRPDWEASPQYFMDRFEGHPEYIRNLHFSYVVLLRALSKAAPFLSRYEIRTGNIVEDETATILLRRLLDSRILGSCSGVFSAFDESIMFQGDTGVNLQHNFKGVFHNVSSILDCVQCHQCKLHGKMAMLGYGAAMKVLFMQSPVLERNEIVALINTIAKFSESIRHVRELTNMYWEVHDRTKDNEPIPSIAPSSTAESPGDDASLTLSLDAVDKAVQLIATLGRDGRIPFDREQELVHMALQKQPELLILAKHYIADATKFLQLSHSIGLLGDGTRSKDPDAVIVGSGLAGLAAALNILDRGGSVVMIEKEHLLGGNSNKASSGINACCPKEDNTTDQLELFREDTLRSAGPSARPDLVETLVQNSAEAIKFLKNRAGVDLSLLAQLGGHSAKRTHRPSNGMAGAEIIYGMQKAVRKFETTGKLKLLLDTRVTELLTDDKNERVIGVKCISSKGVGGDDASIEVRADNVILATGGFAADRSSGSLLDKYRPELLKMPTTAGAFSTGDGVTLATSLGAGTVDMDKVQLHPTGWIDPADPDNTSKILAAELMRGVGGILLNEEGSRFCNELGTRSYVTDKMLSHNDEYAKTGKWDPASNPPSFFLVLSKSAAEDGSKHVELYSHKGFLTKVQGVSELAKYMGLQKSTVASALKKYQAAAQTGEDEFGKMQFRGVPNVDLDSEIFFVGKVTPVLHYCMGGITIDTQGNVVREDGTPIPGLHAAGEVTGGVHGVNRLGGNSLLECTVFGTIVGKKIPIKESFISSPASAATTTAGEKAKPSELRAVPLAELEYHNSPDDCWVAIHGMVYDLTEFAEEHPAGAMSIHVLAGTDGTEAFSAVHKKEIMEDFEDDRIGTLESK